MENPTIQNPQAPPSQVNPLLVQTPTSPKSRLLFIGLALILFGILVGVLAARLLPMSGTANTPTPPVPTAASGTPTPTIDETANWETYTNTKYGFSFLYPSELKLSENCTVYAMGTHITCLQSSDFGFRMDEPNRNRPETSKTVTSSSGFGLFIDIRNTNYQYDISTLQKEYKGSYDNVTPITINNISAFKVTSSNNTEEVSWIMVHNKNIYSIRSPFNTQKHPVIDQILSTFKFTEATPSAKYSCPANEVIDCKPGATVKPECSAEAIAWYKVNCPDFQGAAL